MRSSGTCRRTNYFHRLDERDVLQQNLANASGGNVGKVAGPVRLYARILPKSKESGLAEPGFELPPEGALGVYPSYGRLLES